MQHTVGALKAVGCPGCGKPYQESKHVVHARLLGEGGALRAVQLTACHAQVMQGRVFDYVLRYALYLAAVV